MTESEVKILRKEMHELVIRVDKQAKTITSQAKTITSQANEIIQLKARLAFYESPNMPTSSPSLYNKRRKEFDKKSAAISAGTAGDDNKDTGTAGDDDNNNDDQKSKKRGPPIGHEGISHHNISTIKEPIRYSLDLNDMICHLCVTTISYRNHP